MCCEQFMLGGDPIVLNAKVNLGSPNLAPRVSLSSSIPVLVTSSSEITDFAAAMACCQLPPVGTRAVSVVIVGG